MQSPSVFFAKIISYFFHPLLLPTAGLFLVFHLEDAALWLPPAKIQWALLTLTLSGTCMLPALVAFALLKFNVISSLEMPTKEERRIPYMATSVFYLCEAYLLVRLQVSALIQALIFGAALLVVCTLIINIFWKISAHMVGIGGLCGMMLAISMRLQIDIHLTLMALFLAAGFVGFSRLKLNAHSGAEVYCGFLLGIMIPLILFL